MEKYLQRYVRKGGNMNNKRVVIVIKCKQGKVEMDVKYFVDIIEKGRIGCKVIVGMELERIDLGLFNKYKIGQ